MVIVQYVKTDPVEQFAEVDLLCTGADALRVLRALGEEGHFHPSVTVNVTITHEGLDNGNAHDNFRQGAGDEDRASQVELDWRQPS